MLSLSLGSLASPALCQSCQNEFRIRGPLSHCHFVLLRGSNVSSGILPFVSIFWAVPDSSFIHRTAPCVSLSQRRICSPLFVLFLPTCPLRTNTPHTAHYETSHSRRPFASLPPVRAVIPPLKTMSKPSHSHHRTNVVPMMKTALRTFDRPRNLLIPTRFAGE